MRTRVCPHHGIQQVDDDVPDDGFRLPAPAYSQVPEDQMHISFRDNTGAFASVSLASLAGRLTRGQNAGRQREDARLAEAAAILEQARSRSNLLQPRGETRSGEEVPRARTPPPPASADVPPPSFETATVQIPASTSPPPPPPPSPPSTENPPSWSEVEAQILVDIAMRPETTPDSYGYTRWLARRRDDTPMMMQSWEEHDAERGEREETRRRRRAGQNGGTGRSFRMGGLHSLSWRRALGGAGLMIILGFLLWLVFEGILEMVEENDDTSEQ